MAKYIHTILRDIPVQPVSDIPRVLLHGVSADSRQIKDGYAFVAVKGDSVDGNQFIPNAIENGARLIVSAHPKPKGLNIAWLQIESDPRAALAHIAAVLNGFPA
ncbi:MAG TPA: Mur ligase domain-containing protein, partial [Anaerolineaceae bacterium]|nr:Mur ligase domain-containing protein [Anaerolineaceae bacterium]